MKGKGNRAVSRARKPSLFARVVALIEEARQKVATVANIAQVYTNYEIGRQIVEGGRRSPPSPTLRRSIPITKSAGRSSKRSKVASVGRSMEKRLLKSYL